ncbi:MAG: hypothetical protein EYC70_08450 [Planctomycetota bacterium]|nr:MAG: hypothetical protein EYC70_08450 [Planctomycetota bacterium]
MPLRPLLLVACLLAGASPAVPAQGQPLTELVPADAVLVAEIPDPAGSFERLRAGESWRRFHVGPLAAELKKRPEFLMALGALGMVANSAGTTPERLLADAAGGGAAFAVLPTEPPQTLLLLRALDPDVAQDALEAVASFAVSGMSFPDGDRWRLPMPQGVLERRGDLFLAASVEAALDRLAESAAGSIAADTRYREGRKAVRGSDAFVWLAGDALRTNPIPEKPEDEGGSFLAAPLNEALRHAEWGAAALELRAGGLALRAALPAPEQVAETHAPFFPEARRVRLPRLKDRLGVLVFARDLGSWWTARHLYMSEKAVANSVEGDSGASTLFGRDYGTEVLKWLEPELRFVFARNPDPVKVSLEYPAGAVGVRLKKGHPEDLPAAFTNAWIGLLTILNFEGGSMSGDMLLQDLEALPNGTKLYFARYRAKEGIAPPKHQLSPALSLSPEGEIWISSSTPLLRAILAAPVEEVDLRGDFLELELEGGRPIAAADRETIVAQRALQEGGDVAAAAAWFDRIMAGLELYDGVRLDQRLDGGLLRYELEVTARGPQ